MGRLRNYASPPLNEIPSLRDNVPLPPPDNTLKILRGKIPVPCGKTKRKKWDDSHHLLLDNDFTAPQARDYFDRQRERRPVSGIQFPVQAVRVTWTNDTERDENGAWQRVPNAPAVADVEPEYDWNANHHIEDMPVGNHPGLKNYFPAPEKIQKRSAVTDRPKPYTAPARSDHEHALALSDSTFAIADRSADDAYLRSKELAHMRGQVNGVLALDNKPTCVICPACKSAVRCRL